jgi:hypothetical protein
MFREFDFRSRRLAAGALAVATALVAGSWVTAAAPARTEQPHAQLLTGYEIVTASTRTSSFDVQSTSARCSRGKQVFGGGASILGSSGGVVVFWNGPAKTTGTGSWAAAAHETRSTTRRWSLEVYAICAYAIRATASG